MVQFSCGNSTARKLWDIQNSAALFSLKDSKGCALDEGCVGKTGRGQVAVILTISAPEEFTNR